MQEDGDVRDMTIRFYEEMMPMYDRWLLYKPAPRYIYDIFGDCDYRGRNINPYLFAPRYIHFWCGDVHPGGWVYRGNPVILDDSWVINLRDSDKYPILEKDKPSYDKSCDDKPTEITLKYVDALIRHYGKCWGLSEESEDQIRWIGKPSQQEIATRNKLENPIYRPSDPAFRRDLLKLQRLYNKKHYAILED